MELILCVLSFYSYVAVAASNCANPPPAIANSDNNVTSSAPFAEDTVVEYSCSAGYRPEGAKYFKCVDGYWAGGPFECLENFCPFLDPPEDGFVSNDPTYSLGSYIRFSCNAGYDLQGSSSLRCRLKSNENSQLIWIGTPPTCEIKFCPSFGSIQNGDVFQIAPDGVQDDYGSVVIISCNDGYTLSGKQRIKCQADGTWEAKPECVESVCPDYQGLNSSCIKETYVDSNLIVVYCIEDLNKVSPTGGNDGDAVCMNGQWSDTSISCPCNCECRSDIPGVIYDNCNTGGYLPHNSVLTWRCGAGYRQQPVGRISCSDGIFSREPVCELIPTTQPPPTAKPNPNATQTPKPKTTTPNSTPTGTIIVAVLGSLFAVIAVVAGVFGYSKWKKSKSNSNTPENATMKMDNTGLKEAEDNLLQSQPNTS